MIDNTVQPFSVVIYHHLVNIADDHKQDDSIVNGERSGHLLCLDASFTPPFGAGCVPCYETEYIQEYSIKPDGLRFELGRSQHSCT